MPTLNGEVDPQHGPLVEVCIQIDRSLHQAYASAARPVPMPVKGMALIDTGAVQSGIDEAAALSLGLNPVGVSEMLTPTGERTKVGVFWGELSFLNSEVTPLRQQFLGMSLGYFVGESRVIAILGRDFLRDGRLTYDGPTQRYVLSFAVESGEASTGPREVTWSSTPTSGDLS